MIKREVLSPIPNSRKPCIRKGRTSRSREQSRPATDVTAYQRFLAELYVKSEVSAGSGVSVRGLIAEFMSEAAKLNSKYRLYMQKVTKRIGNNVIGMISLEVRKKFRRPGDVRARFRLCDTVENLLTLLRQWSLRFSPAV